jgi:hypothetical protein
MDADGWPIPDKNQVVFDLPYPAPGPDMVPDDPAKRFHWPGDAHDVPNEELRPNNVPGPTASWTEITWFAAHFDGYHHYGHERLADLANGTASEFSNSGAIPDRLDLSDLRACLFFEHRRHHHFGHAPDTHPTAYIRGLIEKIRQQVLALP